jgi:calcium-dependent protein kinase
MYFILCGYLPFIGESDKDVVKCVIRGVVAFETIEWVDVKAHTMDFIGLLLKKNFRARYTAEQALHHDWFATYVEKISQAFLRHDLLSNLYSFRKLNKLKRSALTVLASMLRTEDVKESHNVFVSLDNNGDGSLSISELRKALAKQKGSKAPQGNLEGVFQDAAYSSLDDKLNPFTYTEFLAATFDRKQCITDKLLRAVFSTFDKNDDGSISLSELSEGHLLGHLSLEELAQTFEDLDLNGDCFLDFDEFSHMMRS